jgi:hypothetical protein
MAGNQPAHLLGQGIDSMSLNPDTVVDTWYDCELLKRGTATGMQYVLRSLLDCSRQERDVLSMTVVEIQPRGAPS